MKQLTYFQLIILLLNLASIIPNVRIAEYILANPLSQTQACKQTYL
jgi:hypothetical protein